MSGLSRGTCNVHPYVTSVSAMARAHVILPDEIIERIDENVGKRQRSRFLEEAAREKLQRLELEQAIRETAGIARGPRYRHWRDQRAINAWVRRGRRTEGR